MVTRKRGWNSNKKDGWAVKTLPDLTCTKVVFEKHLSVQIKVILDRQPLSVGEGRLPNWLRTKKGLIALDLFDDYLCVRFDV